MRDSFSMVRLRAAWAAPVIESASSRMMILNGGHGLPLGGRQKTMSNSDRHLTVISKAHICVCVFSKHREEGLTLCVFLPR